MDSNVRFQGVNLISLQNLTNTQSTSSREKSILRECMNPETPSFI